ncbi:cell division protein FtsH [Candidatus Roizmanbacteria bacterium RIFCSPLOWO2_12_FULL_40_12]|uniref:ATP-dependent zinc metalloprotease FtsH n=1 Tax=Candidatus Roizmanbacteria bacterium RIFCSPLOWO2_01_FULL_40_42 TaxID=1802066 RepID=A0A1F7J4N3_9BACT|nr:MAG: cell division protein FtsH [Candidatus Roizmanbacteria bacterium RIFCSPHIGHO2_01_FULL_40_98]OGK27343.1 MAG: cell division protein FtsH [Candidatus Roizmanbacteria bacterium RIFCSPHIGHO2_02_FULL_40_53]OGK30785.1 MAG: cell division protein FtsH [Candidatus Roizmanbacteria bacterium RIFCSPHIGHO2_12_41_18]OGK36448.1 MAG: cell division protein FtsH [Candidatus Roizmanbacteria bacterium RIFCSPHIGHO2_12_FULL_40_130]OGK50576.1 MAG: cell division protein FtsH [Candidatus Roizmanbacteria bacteriu
MPPQKKGNNSKGKKLTEFRFNVDIRTLFIIIFIGFFLFFAFQSLSKAAKQVMPEKSITTVVKEAKAGKVKKVEIIDNKILVYYNDEKLAIAYKETGESFLKTLKDNNVNLDKVNLVVKDTQGSAGWVNFLANIIPTILMVAFFIFLFRQAKGAQESVFSFGQSRAKRFSKDLPKVTFKDVAGVDEAKKELEEVVDFLKNPEKYKKLGARTPKGVILIGPAGCGKTLLAKAVAGEAGVAFFSIAGSEFMEMLVGIGAARARDLFATAKKNTPAIIFIDEVDAIGRARSVGVMPSHDEREQTLNQILVEMDGFTPTEQVVVIAATNRGDLLDPALLRPGRFDRRIIVDYPDLEGRKAILKIHARNKPFTDGINWDKVAKRTVGFSGADLENMLNEAAILVAREARDKILMQDLEEAATKVKLGPEKKRLQSDLDKKLTAYHEAGHAVVSHFLTHTDPVHRISIVSRGMALGFTLIPPVADKLHETKSHLLERISVMMGGRAAEDIFFGEITTGAANDFDQATTIAKAMVIEYGMSDLGPINFGPNMDITQMGKAYYQENVVSQEVLGKIDAEVKRIITECYDKAVSIIRKNKVALEKVAKELVKKESLDQDEFESIVGLKQKLK